MVPLTVNSLSALLAGVALCLVTEVISNSASDHDQTTAAETREYCQWEKFEASCDAPASLPASATASSTTAAAAAVSTSGSSNLHGPTQRVIVMRTARYGLMKVGRCVAKDYGYVGCSSDVISHVDSLCSGRRQCSFTVPDEMMRLTRPCPREFSPYLEVSYGCVNVVTSTSGQCGSADRQRRPLIHNIGGGSGLHSETRSGGYLASSVADATGQGSPDCPWLLRAAPGQRISIALLDFSSHQHHLHQQQQQSVSDTSSSLRNSGVSIEQPIHIVMSSSSVENEVDRVQYHHHHQQQQQQHQGRHEGRQQPDSDTGANRGCTVPLAVIREHSPAPSSPVDPHHSTTAGQRVTTRPSWETVVCSMGSRSGGGAGHNRERVVYLSTSNELEITITRHSNGGKYAPSHAASGTLPTPPSFLLRYQVVGCETPKAPNNGWMQLSGNDVITTGCNNTTITTHDGAQRHRATSDAGTNPAAQGRRYVMRCDGNRWVGEMANCTGHTSLYPSSTTLPGSGSSQSVSSSSSWLSMKGEWTSPLGILFVSSIGVIIGLVVGVTLLFIVIFIMKRRSGECADSKRRASAAGDLDEFAAMTPPAPTAAMLDSSGTILNPTVVNGVDTFPCPVACRCGYGRRSPVVTSLYESGTGRGVAGCETCAKLELVALRNAEPIIAGSVDSSAAIVGSVGQPYGSLWSAANGDCSDDVVINTCYAGGSGGSTLQAGPGSDPTSPLLYRQPASPHTNDQRTYFTRGRPMTSGRDVSFPDGGRTGCNYERGGTIVASTLVAVNTTCQAYESPKRRQIAEQQTMRLPPDVTSSFRGFHNGATPLVNS